MTAPAPEFSRPLRVDTLSELPQALELEANVAERFALARRFRLEAVEQLDAQVSVSRIGDEVRAEGRLRARVVQTCVATAEPVPAEIDETFSLVFRPAKAAGDEEEIELGAADLDVTEYEGGDIDLGEAVAETMALSLDPYPRAPHAAETLKAAGVVSEGEAGPFAALAALKEKMSKKES